MKIVFFGTSGFGAIVLEKMAQASFLPVLVVTTPDMPSGRKLELTPPPVKILAQKYGIPVAQPKKLGLAELNSAKPSFAKPDLFVVAAYGKILPKNLLDIPKYGTLNVHPSLLPKYRGPSPVQNAILNGDNETGVTIMLMDEKIDHGPILAQQELKISNDQFLISKASYTELHNKLAEIGANLLIKTIPDWVEGKIKAVPQDHSKATFTKMFAKKDGHVDWKKPAEYIERQVRALNPWPGTYTKSKIRSTKSETNPEYRILKILKADVYKTQNETQRKPGKVFLTQDKKLAIQAGGNVLIVEELQLEGGRQTSSSKDFFLGHRDIIGMILQ